MSISSAVRRIREETGSHSAPLGDELLALRFGACDRLLEAAVAMRGVCRAFDEIVMDAIDGVVEQGENSGITALAIGWASDHALSYRKLATMPVHAALVVADTSVDNDPLRAASDNLRLQLRFRGLNAYTLRGPAILELRAVAALVGASAVLFVGGPPEDLGKAPATGLRTAAAFRAARPAASGTVVQLSPRPSMAADELLTLVAPESDAGVPSASG